MKYIFFISCILAQTSKVFAQDSLSLENYYPKPKITSIEILLGPSSVAVSGDNQKAQSTRGGGYFVNSLKNKTEYSFGIGLNHKFGKHFELNARFFWERKGYIENLDSITLNANGISIASITFLTSEDVKNDYFTFSILPQFTFGKRVHFNIGAGGYVGSLISSNTQVVQSTRLTYSYLSDQAYRKYDLGLSINVGFSYLIKTNLDVTLQFTANYGLWQISDWLASFNYPPWYNRSYSFLIGIRYFNKKHKFKINQ